MAADLPAVAAASGHVRTHALPIRMTHSGSHDRCQKHAEFLGCRLGFSEAAARTARTHLARFREAAGHAHDRLPGSPAGGYGSRAALLMLDRRPRQAFGLLGDVAAGVLRAVPGTLP